jgi:hypothetical protein
VQGFNWPPGPVSIYLVPESQRPLLDGGDASVLYALAETTALSAGMFTVNAVIPTELLTDVGLSGGTTAPGTYVIAARGAGGSAVGVTTLTIR